MAPRPKESSTSPSATGSSERLALAKHAVDAAALPGVVRAVALEDHAVAALDRRGQLDQNASLADGADLAQVDAPLGRAVAGHQGLVVAAFQPAVREAAGEGDLQLGDLLAA